MDFKKTVGHGKQKELFKTIMDGKHLSHAYVFVGPEKIGKTTFARDLAEILGADPIMDIFLFDGEEEFGINEAREIKRQLSLTPAKDVKVAIVANSERMNISAANSLLKLLEEPASHSFIFFTVSNPSSLLPTIASRVQKVYFTLNSDDDVGAGIASFGLDDALKEKILSISQGKIGLAINLAEKKDLLNFHDQVVRYYEILLNGTLVQRLQASESLSALEMTQLDKFIKISMTRWLRELRGPKLGLKFLRAWNDLKFNLNKKLLLDNLFLP